MDLITEPIDRQSLHKLNDEFELAARRARDGRVAPERLRGLRIRARAFLDAHRRALSHAEAVALRDAIEAIDRLARSLPQRQ